MKRALAWNHCARNSSSPLTGQKYIFYFYRRALSSGGNHNLKMPQFHHHALSAGGNRNLKMLQFHHHALSAGGNATKATTPSQRAETRRSA